MLANRGSSSGTDSAVANRNLIVLPAAIRDLEEIRDWYNERDRGVGSRFLDEIDACFSRIIENPELAPRIYRDFRRALVRRFPYSVFYEFESDRILIYAVVHSARNPLVWRRRLR